MKGTATVDYQELRSMENEFEALKKKVSDENFAHMQAAVIIILAIREADSRMAEPIISRNVSEILTSKFDTSIQFEANGVIHSIGDGKQKYILRNKK